MYKPDTKLYVFITISTTPVNKARTYPLEVEQFNYDPIEEKEFMDNLQSYIKKNIYFEDEQNQVLMKVQASKSKEIISKIFFSKNSNKEYELKVYFKRNQYQKEYLFIKGHKD